MSFSPPRVMIVYNDSSCSRDVRGMDASYVFGDEIEIVGGSDQ